MNEYGHSKCFLIQHINCYEMPINIYKPPDNYRDDMILWAFHPSAEHSRSMTYKKQVNINR